MVSAIWQRGGKNVRIKSLVNFWLLLRTDGVGEGEGASYNFSMKSYCSPMSVVKCLFSVTCLLFLSFVSAQPLDKVLEAALSQSPKLQSSVSSSNAVAFEVEQAKAALRWRVGLVSDLGRGLSFNTGASSNSATDTALRGYLLLYDGGKADNEIDRQDKRLNASVSRIALTREQVAAQVVDLYLEVLKQRDIAKLVGEQVASITDLFEKVEAIVVLDRGRSSELSQVYVRLQQAKSNQLLRVNAASEAQSVLDDLAGFIVTTLPIASFPKQAADWPTSFAQVLSYANEHPLVKLSQSEAQASLSTAKIAAAWNRPRVELQTGLNSPFDATGQRRYFSGVDVRISVNWQPYDGGAGAAGASASSQLAAAAAQQVLSVKKDISADAAKVWTQIKSRDEQFRIQADLAIRAQTVKDAYWEQFKIGRRAILDLLNADNETFQARLSARQEFLEGVQAQYKLLGVLALIGSHFNISNLGVNQIGSNNR
jgi:outer membrane protein, adhesin transport system